MPEAIGRANATAGLSVLFAGVTVLVAIAGLQVSGIPMMTMMGWASALMVGVVMLAAITLLPAVLGIVKRKVNSLRVPFVKQKPANNPRSKSARWAAKVVAKPVRFGLVAARAPRCPRRTGLRHAARLRRRRQRRARPRPPARPTTSSPTPTVPASTARCRSSSSSTAPPTTRPPWLHVGKALTADPGVASVDDPDDQPEEGPGGLHRHAHHGTAGREDRPAGQAAAQRGPAGHPRRPPRGRVRDRWDADAHRHLVAAAAPDAVVPRCGDRAGVPGPADRVPLDPGSVEGGTAQRAQRRRGVRRARGRVPVGLGRRA